VVVGDKSVFVFYGDMFREKSTDYRSDLEAGASTGLLDLKLSEPVRLWICLAIILRSRFCCAGKSIIFAVLFKTLFCGWTLKASAVSLVEPEMLFRSCFFKTTLCWAICPVPIIGAFILFI
jgi:hypothetical protein